MDLDLAGTPLDRSLSAKKMVPRKEKSEKFVSCFATEHDVRSARVEGEKEIACVPNIPYGATSVICALLPMSDGRSTEKQFTIKNVS
ncbi:MAG: hypothetical protein DMG15_11420 [Acidobacteria bacterium]|nr:MAG: hypothetical protein DMG15_11420 [Acidobacteriota bacterium]